jgi:hypothetical protein
MPMKDTAVVNLPPRHRGVPGAGSLFGIRSSGILRFLRQLHEPHGDVAAYRVPRRRTVLVNRPELARSILLDAAGALPSPAWADPVTQLQLIQWPASQWTRTGDPAAGQPVPAAPPSGAVVRAGRLPAGAVLLPGCRARCLPAVRTGTGLLSGRAGGLLTLRLTIAALVRRIVFRPEWTDPAEPELRWAVLPGRPPPVSVSRRSRTRGVRWSCSARRSG